MTQQQEDKPCAPSIAELLLRLLTGKMFSVCLLQEGEQSQKGMVVESKRHIVRKATDLEWPHINVNCGHWLGDILA